MKSIEVSADSASAMARLSRPNPARLQASKKAPSTKQSMTWLSSLREYEPRRAAEAKRLNMRASVLDRLVKQKRKSNGGDTTGQGRTLNLHEHEPWHGPVAGDELLSAIRASISRYIALPDHCAEAITLWIVHSHAPQAADFSPRLIITSPIMRCGKSTLLRLIGALVTRKLTASNLTGAVLFRSVEMSGPTLLVDEADSFSSARMRTMTCAAS